MSEVIINAENVVKDYSLSQGVFRKKEILRAVDGVSLKVLRGEVLALVGESGCGKTTLAKIILGLLPQTSGFVQLNGQLLNQIPRLKLAKMVQPVFQDPYSSLNPRKTIGSIITLPLTVQGDRNPQTWENRVRKTMETFHRCSE